MSKVLETNSSGEVYVENHIRCGHHGYCFAWLDTAFCPSIFLSAECKHLHAYPIDWEELQVLHHQKKLNFMRLLWCDVNPEHFILNLLEDNKNQGK